MIASIQEALERVLQNEQQPAMQRQELQRLLRMLQFDTRIDQDWEQFAVHFDQVYRDFLQRLRERFSQLSPNDYRLCAYLRMNLNTKEIAHLMNISVRGVEGSRYRLRRKLDLPNDANLVDFLMSV
jgi:DNA-binding CsgD family transcriptional regulator